MVAVVSGRPVAYLRRRVGDSEGLLLYGLYGLERAEGGEVSTEPAAEGWRDTVAALAATATDTAPQGVGVEPKGLTLTLHYRRSPQSRAWVEEFAHRASAETGMTAHDGKMSIELRPPVEVDKGTVVATVAAGRDIVLYAGDDTADLPALAALDAMRSEGRAVLKVVSASSETPRTVVDAADIAVDGPAEVVGFLRALL